MDVTDHKVVRGPAGRRGLSLVEAAVVLAVAAITAAIAIPALGGMAARSRLAAEVNALAGALVLARSQAARHNRVVVICRSEDGATCAGMGEHWPAWVVFADGDGDRRLGPGETALHAHRVSPRVRLGYRGFPRSRYLAFEPTGFSHRNGTFTLCGSGPAPERRAVIVNWAGRVRLARKGPGGRALRCPPAPGAG